MSGFKYRVTHDQQLPELAGTEDVPTGQLISRLKASCRIDIQKLTEEEMVFDLVGVDVSIANALRRILLAELPTMAVETVWVTANTGILQDEILAHRVGLVPIRIDPRLMDFVVDNDLPTDADTLTFHLDVYYPPDDDRPSTSTDVSSLGGRVLSRHLKWLPQGGQQDKFPQGVRPVHDDIVLAQLSPGQRLEFEAHCRKGLGKVSPQGCTCMHANLTRHCASISVMHAPRLTFLSTLTFSSGPRQVQPRGHRVVPPAARRAAVTTAGGRAGQGARGNVPHEGGEMYTSCYTRLYFLHSKRANSWRGWND